MHVIWHKIWNDIWKNKSRTAQVVTIIAMGAFAIGMIITTSDVVKVRLAEVWQAATPAMINLVADPPLDDEQLTALKSIKGVTDVEGYLSTNVEWRLSPDQPWSSASLIARDDYGDQTYAKLTLLDGHWPSRKRIAVEKGSDSAFNIHQGQPVTFRIDDHEYKVQVGGVIFDPFFDSAPSFSGQTQFYASRDEFANLTGQRDFDQIRASAPVYDEAAVKELADRVQRQLEKLDVDTEGAILTDNGDSRILDPSQHVDQNPVDAVFLILGVMGGLTLVLGLLLVYNTITAIVGEQVTQIGVMKAIGAGASQILLIYFSGVLIYGVLALLVAIPLSALGAQQLSNFLLYIFNLDPGPLMLSPTAVLIQTAIVLLAPLLAALVPIIIGARITVREAISTYGLGGGSGLERLLARIRRLSRLVLLTLNNTFRNRGRVIVTQLALVVSGLMFMMIMTVQDSVAYTFSDLVFSILKFNVSLQFEEPERMQEVERLTLAYPGVKNVEMWGLAGPKIRPASQPESNADKIATLFGVPLPTHLYGPQLRAGRWLQPDDTDAVVLNQKLAEDVGVGIGEWVTLDHGSQGESRWLVVGLLFDPVISNSAHVPRAMMLRETRSVNKTSTVWIQTNRTDAASEADVATGLRAYYDAHELAVNPQSPFRGDTSHQLTERVLNSFGIITKMMAAMAVIIALVGSVALSGVLSLSVRERTREIGVMRAIGASSRSIARLFIGEGLILGLLSWLIALPLSIPAGYLMTQAIGGVFGVEIIFHYTPMGAFYWLAIITVLAIAASWLPAHGATRVSVRESLAYQ